MILKQTLHLAKSLQNTINSNMSKSEKNFHQKMQKLLIHPQNKVMLIELLDRSFRSKNHKVSFEFIKSSLKQYGIADFFTNFEKILLFAFIHFGKFAPKISVPFFIKYLRADTQAMVLDEKNLKTHSKIRKNENIILNINLIGEEVLGEEESKMRMAKYEEALRSDYCDYISIKITTIFSQINIIDFEYCKNELVKRLDYLYSVALEEEQRQGKSKFINLDMEEFKDLELTVQAFMSSIAKYNLNAGIVLQAYLPDSYEYLKKLFEFSKQRVLKGLKPIKIRFVKGANMENEETIASQKGWELPTFSRKIDTDSNYNKMLDFVLEDDNYKFINIGIASHNIFEISYAYIRIKDKNALEYFSFEMLEGMSLQCSYELAKLHKLILYAPVCDEKHFNNAIAYLVRRLDENTSEDNFMRCFFNLKITDEAYKKQEQLFINSLNGIKTLNNESKRTQDRNKISEIESAFSTKIFKNESDTDFTLAKNRAWALKIKEKYERLSALKIFPVIKKELVDENLEKIELFDKIDNEKIALIYLAGKKEIQKALQVAKQSDFHLKSSDEIHSLLAKTAQILRNKRGELIGIAARETGKTFIELDAEVSEAIDFVEFYPHSLRVLKNQNKNTSFKPKGIGITIAPWNFPIGISAGTIAAPLAAGNVVIYKPSSLSTVTGYKLCECFWEAGVPKDALIFLPSRGNDISKYLLGNDEVNFAVLTGSEETAYAMLKANPSLMISAETGGKNATIVSKMADREQAIKNIIHSAFSNSGQKCSATSLLILEKELYEDEEFKKNLIDAAKSLNIGSAFDLKNKISSLTAKPNDKIKKALNELKDYEYWALKPKFLNNNEHLMTVGIKYGTKKGDFTHITELFCPILSVICAKNLKEAIDIANSTGYGLTAGLESLDEREWEYFHTHIEAGNIYINKPTTGAIVLRQPFGGIKKSAIGFGRKVGIYNYITQFLDIKQEKEDKNLKDNAISKALQSFIQKNNFDKSLKMQLNKALIMAKSYAYHQENEFDLSRDYVNIRGEDNLFSYMRIKNMAYRVSKDDKLCDILGILIAANTAQIPLLISYKENKNLSFVKENLKPLNLKASFVQESREKFADKIKDYERVRYLAKKDKNDIIYKKAAANAKIIINSKPLINGRFELLYYYNEKSLSISYHRYGNLGKRALKN